MSERFTGGTEVCDAALRWWEEEAGGRVGRLPHPGEAEAPEVWARGWQSLREERRLHHQSGTGDSNYFTLVENCTRWDQGYVNFAFVF